MYENNLPVPIGVGLSLFSTKNTFSTSTAQTFVQVVFFPQIHIYLLYILRKRRKVYQDRSWQSVYYGFTIIRQARQLLYYSVIEKKIRKNYSTVNQRVNYQFVHIDRGHSFWWGESFWHRAKTHHGKLREHSLGCTFFLIPYVCFEKVNCYSKLNGRHSLWRNKY